MPFKVIQKVTDVSTSRMWLPITNLHPILRCFQVVAFLQIIGQIFAYDYYYYMIYIAPMIGVPCGDTEVAL